MSSRPIFFIKNFRLYLILNFISFFKMILKEFGFYLKFLASKFLEVKGAVTKNPAGLCHVLGVEVFYQLELQKLSSPLDPREELITVILKKCTCKPLVRQYPEGSSTAQSGTDIAEI